MPVVQIPLPTSVAERYVLQCDPEDIAEIQDGYDSPEDALAKRNRRVVLRFKDGHVPVWDDQKV